MILYRLLFLIPPQHLYYAFLLRKEAFKPNFNYRIKDEVPVLLAANGEKMNAYRILVGKPEGKRPLGRPRRR
jgi:hypothetical protein